MMRFYLEDLGYSLTNTSLVLEVDPLYLFGEVFSPMPNSINSLAYKIQVAAQGKIFLFSLIELRTYECLNCSQPSAIALMSISHFILPC